MNLVEEVTISPVAVLVPNRGKGITYACKYPNYQLGICHVQFHPLDYFSQQSIHREIYEVILKKKLEATDLLAEITTFYPYTNKEPARLPRRKDGVGSKVLEYILKDAFTERAKAIIVETDSPSMREFLEDKKFQNAGSFYYRLTP